MSEIYVLRECGTITLHKDDIELIDQYYSDYHGTAEYWQDQAEYYQEQVEYYQERAEDYQEIAEDYQKRAERYQEPVEYYLELAEYCQKEAKRYQELAKYYQEQAGQTGPNWRAWCLAELEYYKNKLKLQWNGGGEP